MNQDVELMGERKYSRPGYFVDVYRRRFPLHFDK